MAKFKIIISDQIGKSQMVELEGSKAHPLIGRVLNEVIDGALLGITGKKLKIVGGVDKDGIPMRADVEGGGKKGVILTSGAGFRSKSHGERRRKMIRGKVITEDTYVLNMKIVDEAKQQPKEVQLLEGKST